ncbi:MAG: hypothetical protein AB1330_07575 [Bacillota bacterium]
MQFHELPEVLSPKDVLNFFRAQGKRGHRKPGKNAVYNLFRNPNFPAVQVGKRRFISREAFHRWFNNEAK